MNAVSLLGPVPGVTPDREVGRGATGGSVANFASVLSDEDLRLCESHFRPRANDASSDVPSENGAEGSTTIGQDTTGALLLQLAAQRGSATDAVTTPPVTAATAVDEAMAGAEPSESDTGELSVSAVLATPLSPTGTPTTGAATTGTPEAIGTPALTAAAATTDAAATTGAAETIDTPTTTGAGDVVTPRTGASGSETTVMPTGSRGTEDAAVTPLGVSRLSADAGTPRAPGETAVLAPPPVPAAPTATGPSASVGTATVPSASLAGVTVPVAGSSGVAASSGAASGSTDDAPVVAVDRAQPPASVMPPVAGATPPSPATAPAAAPDAAAAATRAVAAQVSPVVVSIAQRPAGTHHLTLTVNPDSLGPVTLRAHITAGGDVQVELSGATEMGREALRTMLVDLRRDLAGVMPHATLSMGLGSGAESPADRGGQPGAGAAAGDPSASERDGRQRQHPESDPGRTASRVIPPPTTAAGVGLDIFA